MLRRLTTTTPVGAGGSPVPRGSIADQPLDQAQAGLRLSDHDPERITDLAYGQARRFFVSRTV